MCEFVLWKNSAAYAKILNVSDMQYIAQGQITKQLLRQMYSELCQTSEMKHFSRRIML